MQEIIAHYHERVGNREWSGELITSEKGKITDLEGWEITAEDMFLVDIGSSGFTGYQVDKGGFKAADIVELFDAFPGLMEGAQKAHHIHTHHSMGAFMSPTDWSQLNDRGYISNYFLMLVVDTKDKKWNIPTSSNVESWEAHVCFRAKISQSRYQKTYQKTILGEEQVMLVNNIDGYPNLVMTGKAKEDEKDEELTDPIEKEVLCVMQCDIVREEMEELPLRPFQERYKRVAAAVATSTYQSPATTGYTGAVKSPETDRQSYVPGRNESWNPKTRTWESVKGSEKTRSQTAPKKPISDMTQKEWELYEKNNPRGRYKFEHRHARAFLNASMETYEITAVRADYGDAIAPLETFEKACSARELDFYIDMLIYDLRDWQAEWFPGADNEEYLELLSVIKEYCSPYSSRDIVGLILKEIESEIEATRSQLIKDSLGDKVVTSGEGALRDPEKYNEYGWSESDY